MMDLARSKVPPVDAKEITRRCRCFARPPFSSSSGRHALPRRRFWAAEWRNSHHFADCSKFVQSLLKMMTRQKRWSTSAGSGWPQGSSLVVQVSGGALARTSSVAPSIKIKSKFFGEIGSTQFLEQGLLPCSFFFCGRLVSLQQGLRAAPFFRDAFVPHPTSSHRSRDDGINALENVTPAPGNSIR